MGTKGLGWGRASRAVVRYLGSAYGHSIARHKASLANETVWADLLGGGQKCLLTGGSEKRESCLAWWLGHVAGCPIHSTCIILVTHDLIFMLGILLLSEIGRVFERDLATGIRFCTGESRSVGFLRRGWRHHRRGIDRQRRRATLTGVQWIPGSGNGRDQS